MIINAFPQTAKQAVGDKIELCRFIKSGTFNPTQYPTIDGLYDVYIVGGGGGGYKYRGGGLPKQQYPVSGGGGGAKGYTRGGSGAPGICIIKYRKS